MDRDEPRAPAVVEQPKPDYDAMWRDYSTWEADIEDAFAANMADLDRRYKLGGGISAEAYMGERTRLTQARDADLAQLRRGPTYQMLRENYDANAAGQDMVTFYGGPQPSRRGASGGSVVAEQASTSARRGIDTGVPEAQDLLERDEGATWYFV